MLPLGVLLVSSMLLPISAAPPTLGPVLAVCVGALLVAAVVTGLARLIPPHASRWMLSLTGAVGAGAAGGYTLSLVGVLLSDDISATSAWWLLPATLVAVLWGWTGYVVHGDQRPSVQQIVETIPERDRVLPAAGAADLVLPWRCDSRSGSLEGAAIFVLVVLGAAGVLVVVSGGGWLLGVLLGVGGLVAATLTWAAAEVRVLVDGDGLRVRSRRLPLTVLRVPAREVLGARAMDLDPMVWGGTGLRWLPGSTAYLGSGGPGIVVHRRSGRRLAVQLAQDEQAAVAGATALRSVAAQARVGTDSSS
ncbi:MAG: hypothetical protein H0U62_03535 [Actinobacteria bacterium]|nr:hypothetical protein [Actinomycetota bacterium]